MIEDKIYKFKEFYNASPNIVKRVIGNIYRAIPLQIRYGSVYKYYYNLLKQSERWDPEKIEKFNLTQFNKILKIANENTVFYPKYFNGKWKEINCLDEIKKIPMISKENLQTHKIEFLNKSINPKKLLYTTTGGTSGQTIELFWVKGRERARESAFMTTLWERAGYDYSKKTVVLRGNVVDYKNSGKIFSFDPIKNRLFLSVYHLSDNNLPEYINMMKEFNPDFIHTYPSAITPFAKYVRQNNIEFQNLQALFCSSENFYPGQRDLIEDAFKARVFSWYGHSEMGALAGECECSKNYHIFFEYGYFELIDENGQVIEDADRQGEIVVTSFEMTAMPLIRYRTGDFAEYVNGKCECGRSYKLINNVKGRWLQEQIVTKKGSKISITSLNMHSAIFDHVQQYQFYQKRAGALVLRLIKRESFNKEDEVAIKKAFLQKLQDLIDFKIVYVSDFQKTERGKHKFLIQELPLENLSSNSKHETTNPKT